MERTIKLTISEAFRAKTHALGINDNQLRNAIGHAVTWAALHDDAKKDQLDLWLTDDAIISCWYREAAEAGGATKFYMAGHPAPHNPSGYSFHS